MAARRAELSSVDGEGILRLGDADRQAPIARALQFREAPAHRSVGGNVTGAINLAGDRARLLDQRHRVGIERMERALRRVRQPYDRPREGLGAGSAVAPGVADDRLDAAFLPR